MLFVWKPLYVYVSPQFIYVFVCVCIAEIRIVINIVYMVGRLVTPCVGLTFVQKVSLHLAHVRAKAVLPGTAPTTFNRTRIFD